MMVRILLSVFVFTTLIPGIAIAKEGGPESLPRMDGPFALMIFHDPRNSDNGTLPDHEGDSLFDSLKGMFEANQIQITSGTKVNNVIVVSLAEDIEDVRKPILGVSVGVLSKVLMVDEIPVLLAAIKDVKAGLRSTHRASWEDISTKLDSIEKSYTKFQNDTSSIEDDRRLVENIALRAATATELIFTISHLRHFSRMISVWSDTKPVDSSQWSGDPNNAMNAALFAICQDLIVDLKSAREKYLGERTAFDKYVKEQFPDLDFTRIENQSWDVR